MSKFKKEYKSDPYGILRDALKVCVFRYLGCLDDDRREKILHDFYTTLVDLESKGAKAMRSTYEKWEQEEWVPICKNKLVDWIKNNEFESRVQDNIDREDEYIKQKNAWLKYQKIMQIITDGIGWNKNSDDEGWDYKDVFED